jgi:glycosyltransferase involved in cell wall biosynthesis
MPEPQSLPAQPGLGPQMQKVLIVVNSFPTSGGSRIDKFVKFLPEFGFEPIVLSAKEADSPRAQELKQRYYPAGLKTYHAASLGWSYFTERFLMRGPQARHYRLLRLLSFPERCLLVPDYMVRWIPLGIHMAKNIVQREGINVVLTSSPHESTHLIGMNLSQNLGIRWVADFRDLWTEKKLLYRPPTRFHDLWTQRLERKVFKTADYVIANTPENAARYVERFNVHQNRLDVIPNGFDRDDLSLEQRVKHPRNVFRIGYAGALDKHEFPWRIALDALKQLAVKVGRDRVRLVHCGYLSEQVRNYIQTQQIEDLIEIHGMLPHTDAMQLTADTDMRLLLLYENAYSSSIVPMKLYNYLIMNGPILAVAPEEGVTASIIAKTRMGTVISPQRGMETVYRQLHHYYQAWACGSLTVDPDHEEIGRYDRHTQTKRLVEILKGQRECP